MTANFSFLLKPVLLLFLMFGLIGCAHNKTPPAKTHSNACDLIEFDKSWYTAAKKSEAKWGTPIAILKAFVHQESRFVKDARPPREYALGVIPKPRKSSAYGFAQAQNPAWYDYQKATKNYSARRNNKHDAMDFIGWYNSVSNKRNGIALNDAYNLYLAYHEGHGGYSRQTYNSKPWLIEVAKKVQRQANTYDQQLANCPQEEGLCLWPFCR